ncbi:Voltage dependent potassium channel [Parasponia andersonii]|uniref:Voltage dependent potassium channel n=1 Tax=Parasponia andersonii TaxID=3476 RepID=A0A2P5DSV4_PARAD|nr:Voltage dependent potassium channel [Parasponia andersonii]
MGSKNVTKETLVQESGESNRCVIFPNTNVSMVAKTLERKDHDWVVQTTVPSDLVVQIGDSSFHLHKYFEFQLPMVSRSGYLNRLAFDRSNGGRDTILKIPIDNLPGGAKIFELVVKFCYGWEVDITSASVAPLYCAAHFLEMNDDLEQGNLISKSEAFLSFSIFSSWKDTFRILKSCEPLSSLPKELQILKRCSESIALKACTDLKDFSSGVDGPHYFHASSKKVEKSKLDEEVDHWWFEDVSLLRIDHFIEVIQSIKGKGMKSKLVGSCIAHWTTKWLSRVSFIEVDRLSPKNMTYQLQRVTTECLIRVLPTEENSVTCNFLLHLLKAGLAMHISSDLLETLERRIASMLEQCRVLDLLLKNFGDNDNVHDVGIVNRVVEVYASLDKIDRRPKILAVGRLVDGYLTLVAREENLKVKSFQSLVEALPKDARFCDDNLYRATDLYLKAHPGLTEKERTSLCRFLEYHRLSQETREHVIKNNRLPLKIVIRFILLVQVTMTRSMTSMGSNYQRTKTQAFVRANNRSLGKGWMNSQKEIRKMTKDVEAMKSQLNDLQLCKLKLQRQLKRCIV